MNALILLVCLTADAPAATPTAAADALGDSPTGTLLMSHGCCLYVKAYTGSRWTHVGVLMQEQDGPVVYDSQKGVGVRRSPLRKYLEMQSGAEVRAIRPARQLSENRADRLTAALTGELGRPYGVSHFLTGRPSEGLHCSEYASGALRQAGLIRVRNPSDVSPGSLYSGLMKAELYQVAAEFELEEPPAAAPSGLSRCGQCWWETRQCCRDAGKAVTGWLLCW